MGSDNLHHKRKAKLKLSRSKAKRAPYDSVLIVCEGSKTEPLYFAEIKDYYKINSANIHITGECGSDPVSVVSHALELYLEERARGNVFDRVYCVFDQDSFSYHRTNTSRLWIKLQEQNQKIRFFLLPLYPVSNIGYCFILPTPLRNLHLLAE